MMTIERAGRLTEADVAEFGPHAQTEWAELAPLRDEFYRNISALWRIRWKGALLAVIGVKQLSWLGNGVEVFFFLGQRAGERRIALIKFLRRALRHALRRFHAVFARIDPEFWLGRRFVEYLGFTHVRTTSEGSWTFAEYSMRA